MRSSRRTTAPIHRASKLRPSSRAVPYATTGRRGDAAAAVDPELPEHATTVTATTMTATATAIRRRCTRHHPCTPRLSRPSPRSRGPTGRGRRPQPRRRRRSSAVVGRRPSRACGGRNAAVRSTAGARTTMTSSAVRSIVCDRAAPARSRREGRRSRSLREVEDVHERRLVGVVRVHVERRQDRAAGVEDAVDGPAAHVLARALVAVGDVRVLARRQIEPLHPVVVAAVIEHEHDARLPPREPERLGFDVGRESEVGADGRGGPGTQLQVGGGPGLRLGVVAVGTVAEQHARPRPARRARGRDRRPSATDRSRRPTRGRAGRGHRRACGRTRRNRRRPPPRRRPTTRPCRCRS